MANYDRFFIGPMQAGQEKNLKAFMIPDEAFAKLKNAYLFRGRVRKRFGERLMIPVNGTKKGYESLVSRLRIKIGTTDVAGNYASIIPGFPIKVGSMISISNALGADLFTVTTLGVPATLLTNGSAAIHTLNTTTGALTITTSRATSDVYYYPSNPVMGLITYEVKTALNDEQLFAFDTQFAYQFTVDGWDRLGTAVFTGTDADFVWGETHRGAVSSDDTLFVSNFVLADQIKWYTTAAGWTTINPTYNTAGGNTIESTRIIISFKNRLIFLNTWEKIGAAAPVNMQNRCRFSQNGSPLAADAWYEDTPGKGGFIDLPTQETIITAQHLRDRIIVYCERSTWELVYTGNQILPFVWQQLNTELGCESTFSQIPFDQVVLGVGNVGIHACDGESVKRIDQLMPNDVFEIHNQDSGVQRVAGIRDYYSEHAYWTFPSIGRTPTTPYPDQVLAYNYTAQSWALFDDTITAWGYIQQGNSLNTWASMTEFTWAEWLGSWSSSNANKGNRNVLAGNQEGFVFIVDIDKSTNCEVLQITNVTAGASTTITSMNHNLKQDDFILIKNCQGSTELNNIIFPIFSVTQNTFTIGPVSFSAYTGGGTLTRVSRIDILTKQYNFYSNIGKNIYLAKIDFNVDKTTSGSITVDYSTSSTNIMMSQEADATNCSLGVPILETSPYAAVPLEAQQEQVWHPMYFQAEGQCVQLRLYFTDQQMQNLNVVSSDFQWNATIYYCMGISRLQ